MLKKKSTQHQSKTVNLSHELQSKKLIVDALLGINSGINHFNPSYGDTPLNNTACIVHQKIVEELLKTKKINPCQKYPSFQKPTQDQSMQVNHNLSHQQGDKLLGACIDGDMEDVITLLAQNVDINYIDPSLEDTPLSQAAFKGHQNIVTHLLKTNKIDQYSKDLALILAAQAGRTTIMKMLVEHGADVNFNLSKMYLPALFQTIIHNQQSAFKYLIECSNINLALTATQMNNASLTACADYFNRTEMLEILTGLGSPTAQGTARPGTSNTQHNNESRMVGRKKKPGMFTIQEGGTDSQDTHCSCGKCETTDPKKISAASKRKTSDDEHESKYDSNSHNHGGPTPAR